MAKSNSKQVFKKRCHVQGQMKFIEFIFQELSYYFTGIGNHFSFWDLSFENKEHFHLPINSTKSTMK